MRAAKVQASLLIRAVSPEPSSEGSGEPAHPRSLARTYAARSYAQWVKRNLQSDRKQEPWPLWMAGHAQLKFVMTECSKTRIRLTRLILETRNKLKSHRSTPKVMAWSPSGLRLPRCGTASPVNSEWLRTTSNSGGCCRPGMVWTVSVLPAPVDCYGFQV